MPTEDVQSIIIQNSHRIPRNPQITYKQGAPDALIIKVSRMEDRNKMLNLAIALTLSKGRAVRTDLPNQLKKKHGKFAHNDCLLGKKDHVETRIIETKDNVILQFRAQDESAWKKYE